MTKSYYQTKEAQADGYIVNTIKVTHIGDDYGKVEVHWQNGEIFELEIDQTLAVALEAYLPTVKNKM